MNTAHADTVTRTTIETEAARRNLRVLYFASGSNSPGEIRGFAEIGHPVGVAAPHVGKRAEAELIRTKAQRLPIFVDSGAFSEVRFPKNGAPYVVEAITPAEWDRRLSFYERLVAAGLAPQLHLVAPDRVGDQAYTLDLLRTYADRMAAMAAAGATVLVPLQNGELSHADMHRVVDGILGAGTWTPAIPSKKAATPTADVAAYCREMQPRAIHFLGLGRHNDRTPEVFRAVWANSPDTEIILHDSFLIRSKVGRTNGPGGGPRAFTVAKDIIRNVLQAEGRLAGNAFTFELHRRAVAFCFGPERRPVQMPMFAAAA